MKPGNRAELRTKKNLRKGMDSGSKKFLCKILRYDLGQECIYISLENGSLREISLDIIYECAMEATSEQNILCTGRILERYCSEEGAVLKFKIENGFYKIAANAVDK